MASPNNVRVAVLGGGVAGMSAAHELAERGFQVTVYEKQSTYCGGKARSVDVPKTNLQYPDKSLPGEHGFRFFPGFYRHVTDTMKRIPFPGNENGVYDNLTATDRAEIARFDKKPIVMIVNFPRSLDDLRALIESMHADTGLTKAEKDLFMHKVWQLMTSCHDRRANDYERIGWWQFMDADSQSETYQTLLVEGLTRTLVAANAKYASTKTGGDIFLQLIFNIGNPWVNTDRVLDGPTNDVWLTPWLNHLRDMGVSYNFDSVVEKLDFADGRITGAWVKTGDEDAREINADYYVLATPVEAAAPLISEEMWTYDSTLKGILALAPSVAWMNGLQFYLNKDVPVVHGHCIYSDSPWAITSISQIQFWGDYDLSTRYNGEVKGILSVDISDWEEPGILYNKPANQCTAEEIKEEVWAQIKKSLNYGDSVVLSDDMLVTWYLDNDIECGINNGSDSDAEPLLVNRVNTWCMRPEAWCRIQNLMLASDYVRTYTDLATMEGANEAARRAVNCIISASGVDADLCEIWNLHEPDILAPLRWHDAKRYKDGLPWAYHESKLMELAQDGVVAAEKIAAKVKSWFS